jgi:GH24 family phage-related lysozyme (muramidase)
MASESEALLLRIEANQARFEKQMAAIARSAATAAKKAEDSFGRSGSRMGRAFERGGRQAERSVGAMRAQTANLSFQLNDIATQLASGTSPFQVMVQQGGQVAQIFQGSGGILNSIKLLGSGLASLVSPVSLVTLGLIGLTGYLVQYFTSGSEKVPELNELLKSHGEAIAALEKDYGGAGKGLEDYAKKSFAVLKAQEAVSRIKLKDSLKAFAEEFISSGEVIRSSSEDIQQSILRIQDEIAGVYQSDPARARELEAELQSLYKQLNDVAAGAKSVTPRFAAFGKELLDFAEAADSGEINFTKLRDRIAEIVNDSSTPEAIKKTAGELLEMTENAASAERYLNPLEDSVKEISAAALGSAASLNKMNTALAELSGIAAPALSEAEQALAAYNIAMANAQGLEDRIAATKAYEAALNRVATAEAKASDAAGLIKKFEGFRNNAYYDVNAYRAGYGSDTVTKADGSISAVTASTIVTLADAERDLARRIGEFQNAIKNDVGTDLFNSLSEAQKAALTSIAYNYGSLPDRLVEAIKSGDTGKVYAAIRGLGGDNGGVNRARRLQEAELFAKGSAGGDAAIASFKAQDSAIENHAKRIADKKAEIAALKEEIGLKSQLGALEGANTAKLTAHQAARELLNGAIKDGLAAGKELASVQQLLYGDLSQLSPAAREQALAMRDVALSYGEAKAASEGLEQSQKTLAASMQAASAFSKDVLGGFIRDLVAGKSASEALANALSKVADKLLDVALNSLFDTSGGGGGFLGGLLGGIGQLFGFADGGIAAGGKPKMFARGGVSRSAAIFGEAGPEAAVPDGRRIPVALDMKNMKRGGAGQGGAIRVETVMRVEGGSLVPAMVQVSGMVAGQQIRQSSKALPSRLGEAQRRGK